VAAADLPASLAAIVRTTVRRTRLRRAERRDIAHELISHFSEGLAGGAEPERLAAAFGDPRAAARLIRAAARRRRHPLDRALTASLRVTAVATVGIALVYTGLAIRVSMLQPTLRFDGFERLRALAAPVTAPDQAAWPRYRDGLAWLGDVRADGRRPMLHHRPGGAWWNGDAERSDEERALVAEQRALVAARPDTVAAVRAAAARPALGWSFGPERSPADAVVLPDPPAMHPSVPATSLARMDVSHLPVLRQAAAVLAIDAELALAAGDGSRAASDLVAMFDVARHAGEVPVMITQQVESFIVAFAATGVVDAIERHRDVLSDADLERLARRLEAIDPGIRTVDLRGTRLALADMVQHAYSDDGQGDGVLLAPAASWLLIGSELQPGESDLGLRAAVLAGGPLVATVAAGRRETLARIDDLLAVVEAWADGPLPDRSEVVDPAFIPLFTEERWRHPLLSVYFPIPSGRGVRRMGALRMDAARVAVAAEQYRRENGGWPDGLDELVPRFLDAIPRDPFDGAPLRFGPGRTGRLQLWALGEDRDDDGGTWYAGRFGGPPTRSPRVQPADGDLILFVPKG
jgi:hypothetical protein